MNLCTGWYAGQPVTPGFSFITDKSTFIRPAATHHSVLPSWSIHHGDKSVVQPCDWLGKNKVSTVSNGSVSRGTETLPLETVSLWLRTPCSEADNQSVLKWTEMHSHLQVPLSIFIRHLDNLVIEQKTFWNLKHQTLTTLPLLSPNLAHLSTCVFWHKSLTKKYIK